jgi:uncharacterized protein (DUF433 family)
MTCSPAALIARYIAPHPDKSGVAEAWLPEYGVSVWALIAHYRATGQDAAYTARAYGIPLEAMQAALAYYQQHQAALDARLAEDAA